MRTLAIACNAMSTALASAITQHAVGIEVHSLTHHWVQSDFAEQELSNCQAVAIAGGFRTIEQGIYRNRLTQLGKKSVEIIGQDLSRAIEDGQSAEVVRLIQELISPHKHADAILLACTHYPAAANYIREAFPDIQIIDPIAPLYEAILSKIPAGNGRRLLLTTGDARKSAVSAQTAFGIENLDFQSVTLDLLYD